MKDLQVYGKCLIVVDMVNGFVREGILHDIAIATIIPRQRELIESQLEEEQLVIFVKDEHHESSQEFARFGFTKHCLKDSTESQLVSELQTYENRQNVLSVSKNSTSFMESTQFRKILKKLTGLNKVEIVGCCTDICVLNGVLGLSNYFNEWDKDIEIIVHEDAIQTYNSPNHDRTLYTNAAKLLMEQQGIKLVKKR